MNDPQTFMQAINTPAPKPISMPPMDNRLGAEALKTWHDTISGKAPELGLSDTRKSAASWMGQFDHQGEGA